MLSIVPDLESRIDALYQVPLADFVTARQALAKSLTGDDARRVKALAKPTLLPWLVNQIYWRSRPAYDRVLKTGATVRSAQVAALGGRKADISAAAAAHRQAIAEAVRIAGRAATGTNIDSDALARLLETASTSPSLEEAHGRFTKSIRPAGLEALAGLNVASLADAPARSHNAAADGRSTRRGAEEGARKRAADAKAEQEETMRRRHAELAAAEAALARAKVDEQTARAAWESAVERSQEAERLVTRLRKSAS